MAAVADEWRTLLIGARIDTIIQPTEHALAIQCYAPSAQVPGKPNRWLYLSAHPQLARVHLTAMKPPKIATEPPAFVMLLRKHLEGARVESIVQPRWERVLEIVAGYRRNPDSDERTRFRLIIEIMGRVSNIILCDEAGVILGSLRRVGSDVNRYRTIAAGVPYVPPPPQQRMVAGRTIPRLDPTEVTAAQLSMVAAELPAGEPVSEKKRKRPPEPAKLWQLLTRHLLGCSPLLAREMVYRTTENTETLLEQVDDGVWEELAWNVRDVTAAYDTHAWQPRIVERVLLDQSEGETQSTKALLAFAPYMLEQYVVDPAVRVRESSSINQVLDEYYARVEWHDAMESVRAPMRKLLQTQRDRCRRKAELLQQEMQTAEEAALYRLQGELLLAHQTEVAQGPTHIELPNVFEDTGDGNVPLVNVPLDPRFDAVVNANRLFRKYHKLRRAVELVPAQIEQNSVELATVEQLLTDLMLAENPTEVGLVKAEVQAAGYIRGKALQDKKALKAAKKGKSGKQAKGKSAHASGGTPLAVQTSEGFTVLIGKNSRQNEELTFHQATANDIWLHARGVAGAHVVIKVAGRQVSPPMIERVASLAAYYSEARGSTSAPVDYTLQRHVRHMKGGGPGMVIYEREQTFYAEPLSEID
jgi:predicted ribosome quality control (RQC) complex YloA/Tae2 family protein